HASVYRTGASKIRLFNVTANVPAIPYQGTIFAHDSNDYTEQDTDLYGTFTLTDEAYMELQQKFQSQPYSGAGNQSGYAWNIGTPEVHAIIKLTKKERTTLRSMLP
ncbi:MAG: hypothetical protein ABR587_13360, partial [Candidatus Binatia bacterium]